MLNKAYIKNIIVAVAVMVGVALPLIFKNQYIIHIFIAMMIWSIMALGIRVVLISGHLNVAQASFMGIGAYASGVLAVKLGWSFWFCLPAAGLIAAFLALLIGFPTLRIKGAYFVIVTIGLSEVCRNVWMMGDKLFGGPQGLLGIPTPDPVKLGSLEIMFYSKVEFFYLAFILFLLTVFILYRFEKSRAGLILNSIRQQDLLTECLGIKIMKYKLAAFVLGAFFAGLGGAFWAHYFTYCSPWDFTLHNSFTMLMYVMIGGLGSILGPIVGCVVMIATEEVLRPFKEFVPLIMGTILILILLFFPGGLVAIPQRLIKGFRRIT
jgi:branched-chain amino acid transport system permease protein